MFKLKTQYTKLLADTSTPVSIYLKLRDHFAQAILLESSDYHSNQNNLSYICFNPIASVEVTNSTISLQYPDESQHSARLEGQKDLVNHLKEFAQSFETDELPFKFSYTGFFGYQNYDTVRHYEDVAISGNEEGDRPIPDLLYHLYRYVIVTNHFNNELYVFEHTREGEVYESRIQEIVSIIGNPTSPSFTFNLIGDEMANMEDIDYLEMVKKGIQHCQRGDVFQIVLSRQFSQTFQGDEFNVYRALRSINPSPYLFYCDFGGFKIMGSSPEAQLIVENGRAQIHPIAGTFKRTGNDQEDARLARELFADPKENSEHVMLVDLARNDLSRNGKNVTVETFKEIQFYSHVIHLVSIVTADLLEKDDYLQLNADTFPAGTLSGAPKHMAMNLIEKYEPTNRGIYGGCIGFMDFMGNFNQAILIRSFLSIRNRLYFQAGAGIVAKSVPESELQEVSNKLAALRKAMKIAESLNQQQSFSPILSEIN